MIGIGYGAGVLVVDETVGSAGDVARNSSGSKGPFCAHRPRVFGKLPDWPGLELNGIDGVAATAIALLSSTDVFFLAHCGNCPTSENR